MIRLTPQQEHSGSLQIPLAPLVDILLCTLIFFMAISVLYQRETELGIHVPKAEKGQDAQRAAGEIIINVAQDGGVVINQKRLSAGELETMLAKLSQLYPNQPVVIRADKRTYHEAVVAVLDACASANIWNIAFSTSKE
ncbi:MAG: biopolymer transporter ExbD [Candidatus Omnitrophica bacterium]|jgi:biopolymer transport protein ExbD|nr:biopolymer transporter ExbD [Candidatus Omnitrophota bacterium]